MENLTFDRDPLLVDEYCIYCCREIPFDRGSLPYLCPCGILLEDKQQICQVNHEQ